MEDSHHVNWNSIIYRKGFCTFLLPYYVIISNLHVCSFTGMIFHVHERAPKMVLRAQNLVYEKS